MEIPSVQIHTPSRARFSIYGDRAGVPTATRARVMGHKRETMIGRYQRHQAVMSADQVDALEAAMFGAEASLGLPSHIPGLQSILHGTEKRPKR